MYGVHTVRITFMNFDYTGHITLKIHGNLKGFDILENVADWIDPDVPLAENDCSLCWDDDMEIFRGYLTNSDGEKLEIEEDQDELKKMIVCVEIIDFTNEEM